MKKKSPARKNNTSETLISNQIEIKAFISSLLAYPGIYKMIDDEGNIIYIGKAKNLKKRISSYFQKKKHTDIKTTILVSRVARIETIVTKTEREALLLENQLIKTHQPKYNINLKDDKNYPCIKLSIKDPFPAISITRNKYDRHALYFGPYANIGSTKKLLQTLYDLFPLRQCRKSIDLITKQKKCILFDINKCMGPCIMKDVKSLYVETVSDLIMFLSGKNKQLLNRLQSKMSSYASNQLYEKAAKIRDQISKVKALNEKQTVILDKDNNIQIWVNFENQYHYYVLLQKIESGKLLFQKGIYVEKKDYFSREEFLYQVIQQNFSIPDNKKANELPAKIICTEDYMPTFNKIKRLKKTAFSVSCPKKGVNKILLDNALLNARLAAMRLAKENENLLCHNKNILLETKIKLNLSAIPDIIIGFDISHHQGEFIVGSAVYFKNGKPCKSMYRKFMVKNVYQKSNDPLSIYEVVLRRLKMCITHKENTPDLLLIDGGKPQLNYAWKALKEICPEQHIDIIALAKKEEEIHSICNKKTISPGPDDPSLKLLQNIRDEAHRFAKKYQAHKKSKSIKSILTSIKGLGPKRVNLIYKKYKNLENLYTIDTLEIAKLGNMGLKLAHNIKELISNQL